MSALSPREEFKDLREIELNKRISALFFTFLFIIQGDVSRAAAGPLEPDPSPLVTFYSSVISATENGQLSPQCEAALQLWYQISAQIFLPQTGFEFPFPDSLFESISTLKTKPKFFPIWVQRWLVIQMDFSLRAVTETESTPFPWALNGFDWATYRKNLRSDSDPHFLGELSQSDQFFRNTFNLVNGDRVRYENVVRFYNSVRHAYWLQRHKYSSFEMIHLLMTDFKEQSASFDFSAWMFNLAFYSDNPELKNLGFRMLKPASRHTQMIDQREVNELRQFLLNNPEKIEQYREESLNIYSWQKSNSAEMSAGIDSLFSVGRSYRSCTHLLHFRQ